MFFSFSSISLNLSNLNTINVTDMSYMFYHCSSLISLNLSSFNTCNEFIYNLYKEYIKKIIF